MINKVIAILDLVDKQILLKYTPQSSCDEYKIKIGEFEYTILIFIDIVYIYHIDGFVTYNIVDGELT